MVRHRRSPSVQHGGDADAGAQMRGVDCEGQHRLGRGLEQESQDKDAQSLARTKRVGPVAARPILGGLHHHYTRV